MGKLIRNGIEYGGGNGTDIFEVDQDTYNTLKAQDKLVHNALYVITDAPNLNATANDLSMGSAPYASGSVGKAITEKQDKLTYTTTWATLDTNYTDGGGISCRKTDKICVIDFNVKLKNNLPNDTAFASGLPTTNYNQHFLIGNSSGIVRAYIDGDKLKVSDTPQTAYYTGSMVYICT